MKKAFSYLLLFLIGSSIPFIIYYAAEILSFLMVLVAIGMIFSIRTIIGVGRRY